MWTIACLALYFLFLVGARWHHIAKSLHVIVAGQLAALSTRIRTEVGIRRRTSLSPPAGAPTKVEDDDPPGLDVLRDTVEELKADNRRRLGPLEAIWEFLFWSRGRENATWVAIHEVERQLAAFLAPPEQVEAYLRMADAELRVINRPGAAPIADAIRTALQSPQPLDDSAQKARKALLGRAISIIFADRDMSFSTLMEWQNKASFLILSALIIIGFVVAAAGHAVLFLAGAAGGYVSRLMRALRREDVPLDYGASWTTLFLSPLFGALAGWFGIALIALAANPEAKLLGDAFRLIKWTDPTSAETIAVAFLLGFSERFFDAVVSAVEKHAERGDAQQRAAVAAGTVAAAAPQQPAQSGPPVVTAVERQLRAAGAPKDALFLKGSGFATGATAKVNDEVRAVQVQSGQTALLELTQDDVKRIDAAGDFAIVIVNPGGAASKPVDFA